MQYRKFGKLDFEVSALGFGCMRLPTADGSNSGGRIDENEAINMIRFAIDKGVNYADSAYVYHSGKSEGVLGKALKDGYRDKVKVATKSPIGFGVRTKADFDRVLDQQLSRLDIEKIDFYLFHALSRGSWKLVKREDLIGQALAAKKAGKIDHICFSFHDDYPVFEDIINGWDGWDMCQIQYNYMDTNNQAGIKGLKLAASKDIAVVVMEPLMGGKLSNPTPQIHGLIEQSGIKRTASDIALAWLWNQSEVSTVLSGMSSMEQVKENIGSAEISGAGSLTDKEVKLVEEIQSAYNSKQGIPCTSCGYCKPCPNGVNIPRVLGIYNEAVAYEFMAETKRGYSFLRGEDASLCTECGQCEEKCPQKIPISEWMPKIHDMFGK